MYYREGINASKAQGGLGSYREDAIPRLDPTEGASAKGNRFTFDPGNGADRLSLLLGLRNAFILEILALGVGWAAWHFAPLLAAWWRAQ